MAMLRAMAITQSRRLREMTLTMQDLTELDDLGDYAPTSGPSILPPCAMHRTYYHKCNLSFGLKRIRVLPS